MRGLATDGLTHTVTSGSLAAACAVALIVGVVGFLSPCVLPLVPGYLSYVAGLAGTQERPRQSRMVAGALLFVAGFTAVFVSLGSLFGGLAGSMAAHHVALERVFGAITVLMGLVFLGQFAGMQREFKVHRLPPVGLLGAPLLGLTFGLAWTPCLTPTLTAVLSLATSQSQSTAGRGAFLSVFYCLGLGVPFLLVAMGLGWVTNTLAVVRRHARLLSQGGGALLVIFGILLFVGTWDQWMYRLNSAVAGSYFGSGL